MAEIRITGLVAMANRVRRALARPVSAKDVARLQRSVARSRRRNRGTPRPKEPDRTEKTALAPRA